MKIILSAFGDMLRSEVMQVSENQGHCYYLPVWKPMRGWDIQSMENASTDRVVFEYQGRTETLSNYEKVFIYEHQPDES